MRTITPDSFAAPLVFFRRLRYNTLIRFYDTRVKRSCFSCSHEKARLWDPQKHEKEPFFAEKWAISNVFRISGRWTSSGRSLSADRSGSEDHEVRRNPWHHRVKIPFDPNLIQNNTITKKEEETEILASSSFFVICILFYFWQQHSLSGWIK